MTRLCTYSHAHAGTKVPHLGAGADTMLAEHRVWELEEMVRQLQAALTAAQADEAWALRELDAALATVQRMHWDLTDAATDREQLAARLAEADAMRDMGPAGLVDADEYAAVAQ